MSFSQGATGLSQLRSCLEWIKGVTVESVQGNPVYLEWTWTMGSFRIVARPVEFLSTFKLRPPPLEVQRERWYLLGASMGIPPMAKVLRIWGPTGKGELGLKGASLNFLEHLLQNKCLPALLHYAFHLFF